jgi:glycosyltransferase involved in cell wall biosynthesis
MSRLAARSRSLTYRPKRVQDDSASARTVVGLPELATIVAAGPFEDLGHSQQLAAMFSAVQQTCRTQLVLLGTGTRSWVVVRHAAERGLQSRLLIEDRDGPRRPHLLAAADLVIPSPGSARSALVEMMAAGRAVVAAANPVTAQLVMPFSAGLLYRPGDVAAMTAAVMRLLTKAELRHQMGSRASQVAQRHKLSRQCPDQWREYA